MLNKVILIGRLTKDPDAKFLPSGMAVATFTLAVDRTFKSKDGERGTDFVPVVCFSKTAELAGKYLEKGRQTAVSGRIQTRTYDAKDGTKRYVTEVVADEITFLGNKNSSGGNSSNSQANFGVPIDDFSEIDEEDTPF